MMLQEVADTGIFIADLAYVNGQLPVLSELGIQTIISIGCELDLSGFAEFALGTVNSKAVKVFTFVDITDDPSTCLLPLWDMTNTILSSSRRSLVHCVLGQSRSVATVAAYLLYRGYSLDSAMQAVRAARPEECMNPGFLGQLGLCGTPEGVQGSAYRLLLEQYRAHLAPPRVCWLDLQMRCLAPVAYAAETTRSKAAGRSGSLICRKCKVALCSASTIVTAAVSVHSFVAAEVHEMWRDYWLRDLALRPAALPLVTLPLRGHIVVLRPAWYTTSLGPRVCCPGSGCGTELGELRDTALDICSPCGLLCDVFALRNDRIKIV